MKPRKNKVGVVGRGLWGGEKLKSLIFACLYSLLKFLFWLGHGALAPPRGVGGLDPREVAVRVSPAHEEWVG